MSWLWFIQQHLVLLSLTIVVMVLLSALNFLEAWTRPLYVTPIEAVNWINRRKAEIWDLRKKEEFEAGHLPGAKLVEPSQACMAVIKRKIPTVLILPSQDLSTTWRFWQNLKAHLDLVRVLQDGVEGWKEAGMPLSNRPRNDKKR